MKPGFEPGIIQSLTITVTPDMCPAFDGVVVHRVYSTWSVAHHFELAARKVLVDFLESHEEGIGSHVSVDHLAPCPVGQQVRVEARLVEVIRAHHIKVVCDCRAYLEQGRAVNLASTLEKGGQRGVDQAANAIDPPGQVSREQSLPNRLPPYQGGTKGGQTQAANFSSRGPSAEMDAAPKLLATGRQIQVVMNKEHLQRYLERS